MHLTAYNKWRIIRQEATYVCLMKLLHIANKGEKGRCVASTYRYCYFVNVQVEGAQQQVPKGYGCI
jgi:hypothetical protein